MKEPDAGQDDHLDAAIQRRKARDEFWHVHGERSLAKNFALIGVLGWLVVCPMLLGVLAGHWLDQHFDKGITFTAAFVLAGAAIGGYLAWQRVNKE